MTRRITGLVLQGGGALGAYEYGVIKALHERRGIPEVITGVSIGAINAAVLAGARDGDPIAALGRVWKAFAVDAPEVDWPWAKAAIALLGSEGMYRPHVGLLTRSGVDTTYGFVPEPLRETLEAEVSEAALNRTDGPRVTVTAVDVGSGELEKFDNGAGPSLTLEHVLASAALPLVFPMVEIDGRHFWDGGLVSNTPLSEAINLLEAIERTGDEPVERDLVVVELFPKTAEIPTGAVEATDRLSELLFSNKLRRDTELFDNTAAMVRLLDEINEALDADSKVRESAEWKKLRGKKRINPPILVSNSHPEDVMGPFDFSRSVIERRIERGLRDGLAAIPSLG